MWVESVAVRASCHARALASAGGDDQLVGDTLAQLAPAEVPVVAIALQQLFARSESMATPDRKDGEVGEVK